MGAAKSEKVKRAGTGKERGEVEKEGRKEGRKTERKRDEHCRVKDRHHARSDENDINMEEEGIERVEEGNWPRARGIKATLSLSSVPLHSTTTTCVYHCFYI